LALQRTPISAGLPAQSAWSARRRTPKITLDKQEIAAVPLSNLRLQKTLSAQIGQICDSKTSIYSKFYPFASGFATTLCGGAGSFGKFLVIRNIAALQRCSGDGLKRDI
jgi:hypothetical protein